MAWWAMASVGDTNVTGYINSENVDQVLVQGSGAIWTITAQVGTNGGNLLGTYTTKAAAAEVARKLCQGFDPSTV